jgi:hypothetical protein
MCFLPEHPTILPCHVVTWLLRPERPRQVFESLVVAEQRVHRGYL